MAKSTTVSVRLSPEMKDRLETLARDTHRSKSFLAAEAINAYIENNAWQIEGIRKALRKADAGGPFIAHDDVEHYMERLARGEKPKRPKTFKR